MTYKSCFDDIKKSAKYANIKISSYIMAMKYDNKKYHKNH